MIPHFTKKEYEALLEHMVIICQTNEKSNAHILEYFDKNGIKYTNKSIRDGDYSFMLKPMPELGFFVDTYFTDELFIERKNSLQELASSIYGHKTLRSNGTKEYDDAFIRELKRAINKPHKFLLVEQPNGIDDILKHNYPNNFSESAFFENLTALQVKFGLSVNFCSAENMGRLIYSICKHTLNQYIDK